MAENRERLNNPIGEERKPKRPFLFALATGFARTLCLMFQVLGDPEERSDRPQESLRLAHVVGALQPTTENCTLATPISQKARNKFT